MSARLHCAKFIAGRLLHLVGCVAGVLMIFALPMHPGPQLAGHFRAPEVRQSIERHTPLAHPETGSAEQISSQTALPLLLMPINTEDTVAPRAIFKHVSQAPLPLLFLRLKLGSSRSGSRDPLL
jgi:hypothetical protein